MSTTLQDISAIAKKALEDSSNVTESDIAPILSDALEAIVELCQFEQQDKETLLGYLKTIQAGVEQIASGVEVGFSFSKDGVIIHRKNTLAVLRDMAMAAQESVRLMHKGSE